MKSPRKVLIGTVACVIATAGVGWGVSTRLRSPADEAASRTPPKPSLITAPVERTKLVSSIAVSGTLEYGSPLPVTLAGVVGGSDTTQRATRAPRPGKVVEGGVLMEVNGRPVFAMTGKVPMHRTIAPGAKGADIRQLQRSLRRLGYGARVTGVFDQATVAAVTRFYAKKGYEAQQPTLEARQQLDSLRKAVQTAQETLATERKALDQGSDVLPLKLKLSNTKADLKAAEQAYREAKERRYTTDDDAKIEAADVAVRAAEEKLLQAEQDLATARAENDKRDTGTPTTAPTTGPTTAPTTGPTTGPTAGPAPTPRPSVDTALLELRVSNARADLESARRAYGRIEEEARLARGKRLSELGKAVRDAKEAAATAAQALRQARALSPVKLKVANAEKDLSAARSLMAEYQRTYGTTIPPGELVFLPKLPARLHKAGVKAGENVDKAIATVTSSSFVVTGSVESSEADLLKEGLDAVIETSSGKTYPATLTAFGQKAALSTGEAKRAEGDEAVSSEPVLITPLSEKGLKGLSGTAVTAKVTVGATDTEVLVVPVAAVVTAADGKARVQVEVAPDRTKDVEVRTGLTADGKVEVTGDLKEGDRVVVGGA
ncbi:peptidoglycan-binding protein [Nonomuraea africana]|uniref:Peptidoglycan hydrolase-like protein with peptidoglycan-binding domain n=1 Tax=Nonomuraea africana TaxID=46171 RepID=A0ABR9KN51_9ACTN|nr:peptidoglycan-binding protein [Nonomuraea africana]MBE1563450.1 peptidoglycan hydrolase-like protein with peptidoglycan-binding domain [Nonomuraea africana]